MTSFEVPALGALVAAIKFLFDSIGRGLEMPAKKRKQWFNEHIEPSYKELCEIHEDYTKSFSRVLDSMSNKRDLKEAAQLLRADRPHLRLRRQGVRENLLALEKLRREKKRTPQIVIIFYDYVSSVDGYLNAASPLSRETWYIYFIDRFCELVERGTDPFTDDYSACAQGKDTLKIAMEQLSRAIHENMPEAFREVQQNYANLRAQCLSNI